MLNWFALACLAGAIALLYALSVCDLKTRLLPDEMVLGFATLGFVFHLTTLAHEEASYRGRYGYVNLTESELGRADYFNYHLSLLKKAVHGALY